MFICYILISGGGVVVCLSLSRFPFPLSLCCLPNKVDDLTVVLSTQKVLDVSHLFHRSARIQHYLN